MCSKVTACRGVAELKGKIQVSQPVGWKQTYGHADSLYLYDQCSIVIAV